MSRLWCAFFCVVLLEGCLVVPEGAAPEVSLSADLASQYNFRGMVNVDRPVLQAAGDVVLPTKVETGFLAFRTWANVDLQNSTGNAWFPSGHAFEPSQIDFQASYSETYRGFDVTMGIQSYALQNPDDFPRAPNGERGETKELFVTASREIDYGIVPSLSVHWDFDEAEGIYLNAAALREFPIDEKWVADAGVSLGYSDENQSDWNYGIEESGFADARLRGGVSYFMDRHTTLRGSVNFSTIVDSKLRDWFDVIDISTENVWVTLGATWSY